MQSLTLYCTGELQERVTWQHTDAPFQIHSHIQRDKDAEKSKMSGLNEPFTVTHRCGSAAS